MQPEVAAIDGVVITFKRGSGGAEYHGYASLLAPKNRYISRRIAQAVLLFERHVVFFIHDYQSEVWQRREHGEAGAQYDFGICPLRLQPATPRVRKD